MLEELPNEGRADAIGEVVVETSALGLSLDNDEPVNGLASRFSIQHAVAAPLVLGHARPEAFGSASLDSAEIRALRHRIILKEFEPVLPPPHDRPARVTITLADGRRITRECLSAKGGPDRPFSAEELFGRLDSWVASVYPRLAPRLYDLTALRPADLRLGWDALLPSMLGD